MAKLLLKRDKSLNAFMTLLFIASIFLLSVILTYILEPYTSNRLLAQQADVLLETMSSVQVYTSKQVRPNLDHQSDDQFHPESVPSYAAQQVFEQLRQESKYSNFSYKQAVLNPTNLRDKANDFEENVIEQYRSHNVSSKDPIKGQETINRKRFFYEAKAIRINQPSCLQCHSTPNVAPRNMVDHYGDDNGFGWQLKEIVGVQIIYLPLDSLKSFSHLLLHKIMAIVSTIFGVLLLGVRRWLKPIS
ncbi:MAG: DUF3365 domain-containing protein [Cyanobacteria bacterium P01_F01_bin.150]